MEQSTDTRYMLPLQKSMKRRLPLAILILLVGCKSSQSLQRSTPDRALSALTQAMRDQDVDEMREFTTENGMALLILRQSDYWFEEREKTFRRWGEFWSQSLPLPRWRRITDRQAIASVGPEIKEHGLVFLNTSDGWRFDNWFPGY